MSLFSAAADLIGDVGLGVIKHSGKVMWGGGKTVLGVVTGDTELIEDGLGTVAKGSVGLGATLIKKAVLNDDDADSDCGNDIFDYDG